MRRSSIVHFLCAFVREIRFGSIDPIESIDKLLFVPLPMPEERISILFAATRHTKLNTDVDLDALGRDARTDGFSGADLAAVVRTAGLAALKQGTSEIAHAQNGPICAGLGAIWKHRGDMGPI